MHTLETLIEERKKSADKLTVELSNRGSAWFNDAGELNIRFNWGSHKEIPDSTPLAIYGTLNLNDAANLREFLNNILEENE